MFTIPCINEVAPETDEEMASFTHIHCLAINNDAPSIIYLYMITLRGIIKELLTLKESTLPYYLAQP